MNIIFLDIDGVLVDLGKFKYDEFNIPLFEKEWFDNLKEIVNKTNCKIVISSSWRIDGLQEIKNIFNRRGLNENVIYDVTPMSTLNYIYDERGEEIKEWLDANPVNKYVVIDDMDIGNSIDEKYFFHQIGIDEKTKEEIINYFNN